MRTRFNQDEKALIRRYLVWCYKTTKEELDRIDRKFTQLTVDHHVLKQLQGMRFKMAPDEASRYKEFLENFKEYIQNKEKDALALRFSHSGKKSFQPNYVYLKNRLKAVEKSILFFLGNQELKKIKTSYEEEMTKRIWEAKEHT